MKATILTQVDQVLLSWGVGEIWLESARFLLACGLIVIAFYGLRWVLVRLFLHFFDRMFHVSKISFFAHLVRNRLHRLLAVFVPLLLVQKPILGLVSDMAYLYGLFETVLSSCLVILLFLMGVRLVQTCFDVLREHPWFQTRPVDSYMQVVKIIAFVMAAAVIFSHVTGKSLTTFFAAMGAASAILLLMFKDTIMGFVASIQVTTNDMVRLGDWITMTKYGADGDVVQITLTTVKVQNFDKTITTIPTYALISDSFQNWRGMKHAGGRRMKRAMMIKQSSIRYIRDEELEHFRKIQGIRAYIDERSAEILAYNERTGADRTVAVNGRNMTNAGLFRHYAAWYISQHPMVNQGMTHMVRQLAPTPTGLPFEVYAFARTTQWLEYEEIMANIFDHLIAAVPFFDLQIFEEPGSGEVTLVQAEMKQLDVHMVP